MSTARMVCLLALVLGGCASRSPFGDDAATAAPDAGGDSPPPTLGDASFAPGDVVVEALPQCGAPTTPTSSTDVVMDPVFANDYRSFVLGPVPGIPPSRLGGCVIDANDPNALLVGVESEAPSGAIYSVPLQREPCGHIVGFAGNATLVATTPYVDANLLYGPNQVMFYSEWPVNQLSEILPQHSTPSYNIDLSSIGVGGGGPGGIGFVPPNLGDPGGLRAVTWPDGYWYHLTYAANSQQTFDITASTQTATLPNGPGGFGYVPKGSPQFANQSLITPEWSGDKVVVYEVDNMGDPLSQTRREFFNKFPKPWGAYFEPKTGDFLFLTWAANGTDQIYIVQGFTQPPPPPPPPK